MKAKRETTVIEIEDNDEDDAFLCQVAKAESEALSASNFKRRKMTTVDFNENQENTKTTMMMMIKVKEENNNEGDYMAALKGSRSASWQQRIKAVSSSKFAPSDYKSNNARGGGGGGGGVDGAGSGAVVPEKICPCGLGVCNVFTANTDRNRGRAFYKCPQRQENGGCGYFQWCDESSATNYGGGFGGGGSQVYVSNSMFPELQCPCGAGSCLILTAKKGENIGKQFYKCPAKQFILHAERVMKDKEGLDAKGVYDGKDIDAFSMVWDIVYWTSCVKYLTGMVGGEKGTPRSRAALLHSLSDSHTLFAALQGSCNFFKWCNDNTASAGLPASASKVYLDMNDSSNKSYGARTGSSCFKCGKEGHWAKDCSVSVTLSDSPATFGASSGSSGTCYKCGQPGHWARDCTSSHNKNVPQRLVFAMTVVGLRVITPDLVASTSLLSDPRFAKLHLKRANEDNNVSRQRLLVATDPLYSVDFEAASDGCNDDAVVELPCPNAVSHNDSFAVGLFLGSCDGILCILNEVDDMVLWNPSTRESKKLPEPSSSLHKDFSTGLGYDSSIEDYKTVIVSATADGSDQTVAEVFTLKTNKWRKIPGALSGITLGGRYEGVFWNGALHWLGKRGSGAAHDLDVIVSFDIAEEKFMEAVPLPNHFSTAVLTVSGNCLCIFGKLRPCGGYFEGWLTSDYGVKKSWRRLFSVPVEKLSLDCYSTEMWLTKKGEVLIDNHGCPGRLKLYHPVEDARKFLEVEHDSNPFYDSAIYTESLVSLG
ncbi:unnamed protein product [Dovyalis caffra]|uniref:Uncharacterized protein n=1 Tax=Dovyalis caffra TaxID=77055 RepID=A0AAV1R343_9ROSI|nr:unnamed protein product [Dovyalis caffra]